RTGRSACSDSHMKTSSSTLPAVQRPEHRGDEPSYRRTGSSHPPRPGRGSREGTPFPSAFLCYLRSSSAIELLASSIAWTTGPPYLAGGGRSPSQRAVLPNTATTSQATKPDGSGESRRYLAGFAFTARTRSEDSTRSGSQYWTALRSVISPRTRLRGAAM